MQTNVVERVESQPPRLRAMVEIMNGELIIYPIAQSESDEKLILDALRFVIEKEV